MNAPTSHQSLLLDVPAAAALLGVSERQLRRYIAEGRVSRVKPAGPTGPVYLKRADLVRLIEVWTVPAERRVKASNRRKPKRSA